MGGIIPFPGIGGGKPPGLEKSDSAAANLVSGRIHAEAIRRHLESITWLTPGDRLRTAENLWRILEVAKTEGIGKADILLKAGIGSKGDSTKHLPRYAIDPELNEEVKTQRARSGLTKKWKPYLDIADAAGMLTKNGDKNRFVLRLFAGTVIGQCGSSNADSESVDVYTELANMIRQISTGIVRKHNLAGVFRHIEEYRVCHKWWNGSLWSCDDDWASLWANFADGVRVSGIDAPAGGEIFSPDTEGWVRWILPYPNLRIGWGLAGRRGGTRSGNLPLNLPFEARRWISNQDGEQFLELIRDKAGKPINPPAEFLAEVRLALLPVGPGGSPEPVFITRLWTHLCLHRLHNLCVADDPSQDDLPSEVAWPWLPSDWLETEYLHTWNLALFPPQDYKKDEASCAEWTGREPVLIAKFMDDGRDDSRGGVRIDLVSAASCRTILNLIDSAGLAGEADSKDEVSLARPGDIQRDPTASDDPAAFIGRTKENTLARAVEEYLFVGGPEGRLDALLDGVCGRVAAEVAAFVQPFETARRETRDQVLEQWHDDDPA